MEVIRPTDAATFLDLAGPLLTENEARHNLILGIAGNVVAHPETYPEHRAWVVRQGGAPVAAAFMTPPWNLILADPRSDDALRALLVAVHADGPTVPGVVGNAPNVDAFAQAWARAAGARAQLELAQGVYRLTAVRGVHPASGSARPAGAGDREVVEAWMWAFAEEALPEPDRDPDRLRRTIDLRFTADDAGFWVWEDRGVPVALAGYGGRTPNGTRVGPVYTPPERRRRGYASNLVAELSRWLLGQGYHACFLYTDLANPTSNRIYLDIGYERVCDSAEYRFLPADPPA